MKKNCITSALPLVDGCPEWVQKYEACLPWDRHRKIMAKQLSKWWLQYSPEVYDPPGYQEEEKIQKAMAKLLECWLWHWKTAGRDVAAASVAQQVENGRGFKRGGKLGGNPFFDIVLARAMCDVQQLGTEYFTEKYKSYLCGIAGRADQRCITPPNTFPDWWGDFYFFLIKENGKKKRPLLDTYNGRSSLKGWLFRVLSHFLLEWLKKEFPANTINIIGEVETEILEMKEADEPFYESMSDETVRDYFSLVIKRAYHALNMEERLRFAFYYVDKLSNKRIAQIFQETEPTASRHMKQVFEKFVQAASAQLEVNPVLRDDLASNISSLQNDLVSILSDYLKQIHWNTESLEFSENEQETLRINQKENTIESKQEENHEK